MYHAPCDTLYLVTMLTECRLMLVIRCCGQIRPPGLHYGSAQEGLQGAQPHAAPGPAGWVDM